MAFPDKLILASSNQGKLKEMSQILTPLGLEIVTQSEFSVKDVEETGLSFVENAILKARHATSNSNLPAVADDSGIEVDMLNGAPGIYSARFAGDNASDEDNLQLLIDKVKESGLYEPRARYQCIIVYMRHADDPTPIIAQGTWEGVLLTESRGTNGFGYDPIFYVPTHQCTSAELQPEEKNRISHRGQALRELLGKLSAI